MLKLTMSTEEYLMIGDDVKIVFLGGSKNNLRIMVNAPKDVNIVRSKVLENRTTDPGERAALPKYYAEPELPERYRKPRAKKNAPVRRNSPAGGSSLAGGSSSIDGSSPASGRNLAGGNRRQQAEGSR